MNLEPGDYKQRNLVVDHIEGTNLYVSGIHAAQTIESPCEFSLIINVCETQWCESAQIKWIDSGVVCHHIPIADKKEQELISSCALPVYYQIKQQTKETKQNNTASKEDIENGNNGNNGKKISNKILIHCHKGISRSVSCILFILMKDHQLPFDSALCLLKDMRAEAEPNEGFQDQLSLLDSLPEIDFTCVDQGNGLDLSVLFLGLEGCSLWFHNQLVGTISSVNLEELTVCFKPSVIASHTKWDQHQIQLALWDHFRLKGFRLKDETQIRCVEIN